MIDRKPALIARRAKCLDELTHTVVGLTRYGWNFSVVFYGIIPSNPLVYWEESDKSGVMVESSRIIRHLGSGMIRA
jgi:hypothetical protein